MDYTYLRNETMGYGNYMEGPYGKRLITYADYTASGKSLRFLENYYLKLQETYANTHTEDDYTGRLTTQLYKDAKAKIRQCVGANENYSVLPSGMGATGAIEKLSKILGIYMTPEFWRKRNEFIRKRFLDINNLKAVILHDEAFRAERPVVFISSYEHHSNEVQWREGFAEVVKIGLDSNGLFDLNDLVEKVSDPRYKNRMKIGSFSAASNVTGLKTPVYEVARLMHKYDGYVFFDFATSGPYVDINMTKCKETYFDGIFLSMHKFLGGPGASGLLILNKALYCENNAPTTGGGGTVKYVTEDAHEYVVDQEEREDAGTPGIMQVMRAAMVLELKDAVGVDNIEHIESEYIKRAFDELSGVDNLVILGNQDPNNRLAILSFNIKYKKGYLHHGFVTTLLNDLFGIQSRAGCACAGPYGIKLLDIDEERVEKYKEAIRAEIGPMKPGWTRVNFHYTLDEATFSYIIEAIRFIANFGHQYLEDYKVNCVDGRWVNKKSETVENAKLSLKDALLLKRANLKTKNKNFKTQYTKYLKYAYKTRPGIACMTSRHELYGNEAMSDIAWFYHAATE